YDHVHRRDQVPCCCLTDQQVRTGLWGDPYRLPTPAICTALRVGRGVDRAPEALADLDGVREQPDLGDHQRTLSIAATTPDSTTVPSAGRSRHVLSTPGIASTS